MSCWRCGGEDMVDITTLGDLPGSRYICQSCGASQARMAARSAPFMAPWPYGPALPTPEELLAAGQAVMDRIARIMTDAGATQER